jgi:hypothetical protein
MFNRREVLAIGAGSLVSGTAIREALRLSNQPVFGGWLQMPGVSDKAPRAQAFSSSIRGISAGKASRLWPIYEKVTGKKFQPNVQGDYGTCCGEAGTLGAQFVSAIQVAENKRNEEHKGPFSVEYTYAASRVEVGGGKIRRGDGSCGEWTAQSMQQYGLLPRAKYGQYDLRVHSGALARQWGVSGVGVPDILEPVGKQHPIKLAPLVESWEEAADCLAAGCPILLCSSLGFNDVCDRQGFLTPDRIWWHAMLLVGADRRKGKREGGCILNSWGPDWLVQRQHELGTPAGGFWADAWAIDWAIKQKDSYALSDFVGFRRRNLEYLLY